MHEQQIEKGFDFRRHEPGLATRAREYDDALQLVAFVETVGLGA